jgi:hypothetical protein
MYPRFFFIGFDVAQIEKVKGFSLPLPIVNLSYSGIGLNLSEIPDQNLFPKVGERFGFEMNLIGNRHSFEGTVVHHQDKFAGIDLIHYDNSSLAFLRPFIENMRRGHTAEKVDKSNLKEKFQSPEWIVLRGDGPIDITLRNNPRSNILEYGLLTFPVGEQYAEVEWREGKLFTLKALDKLGVSPRMEASSELDDATLQEAVFILIGAHFMQKQAYLALWIQAILAHLQNAAKP